MFIQRGKLSLISSFFFFNSSLKAIRSIFSKGSPDNFENVSRCWFIRGVVNIAKDGLESFIWPVKSVIIITVGAIGNYRPWGCSILSGSLSAWDREQGSEGQEEMQKGNRERLLRQRCGNSVAKFGSASWNESHQFFFSVPSHYSWNLSSLIYRILFSPNRHRLLLILLFLSHR